MASTFSDRLQIQWPVNQRGQGGTTPPSPPMTGQLWPRGDRIPNT